MDECKIEMPEQVAEVASLLRENAEEAGLDPDTYVYAGPRWPCIATDEWDGSWVVGANVEGYYGSLFYMADGTWKQIRAYDGMVSDLPGGFEVAKEIAGFFFTG